MTKKLAECKRCGKKFTSKWCASLKMWERCCTTCQVRNLHDGLNMPTPPELIDPHTKHPTLTQGEYDRAVERKKRKKRKKKGAA